MKVGTLKAMLSNCDDDAEVVCTSGIGWPTFNPLDHTASIRVKNAAQKWPYWYEKVDDLDQPSIEAVLIY
jgi:hypothetical protein